MAVTRDLDGNIAKKPVAYCKLHRAVLTIKQLKRKHCLAKRCWHMVQLEHNFWKQREERKEKELAARGAPPGETPWYKKPVDAEMLAEYGCEHCKKAPVPRSGTFLAMCKKAGVPLEESRCPICGRYRKRTD